MVWAEPLLEYHTRVLVNCLLLDKRKILHEYALYIVGDAGAIKGGKCGLYYISNSTGSWERH